MAYIPYLLVAGPPKQTAAPAFWEGLPKGEGFFSLLRPGSDGDCPLFFLILCSLIKREHLQKSHSHNSTQKTTDIKKEKHRGNSSGWLKEQMKEQKSGFGF